MSQTRLGSGVEAWINTSIGLAINLVAQWFIFPAFGLKGMTVKVDLGIAAVFTAISLVRSFLLRRLFNSLKWGNR